MIDGVASTMMSSQARADFKIYVIILAIAASLWVNFARTVRGSTLVEKNKEYVQAAKVIGIHPILIMIRHVLPNVMGPVLVIATAVARRGDFSPRQRCPSSALVCRRPIRHWGP